eukprot:1160705-Pelagomonas_calceolata.AAC.18
MYLKASSNLDCGGGRGKVCMALSMRGPKDAWAAVCMALNMRGPKYAWPSVCVAQSMHGPQYAWPKGCMGHSVHGPKDAWAAVCMALNMRGPKDAWPSVCVAQRMHGPQCAWPKGCMGHSAHGGHAMALNMHGPKYAWPKVCMVHDHVSLFIHLTHPQRDPTNSLAGLVGLQLRVKPPALTLIVLVLALTVVSSLNGHWLLPSAGSIIMKELEPRPGLAAH